jgi:hypothetical protein
MTLLSSACLAFHPEIANWLPKVFKTEKNDTVGDEPVTALLASGS